LELEKQIAILEKEKSQIKAEFGKLKIACQPHGSRIHQGIMPDATCFNCESNEHTTFQCPLNLFIR